MKKKRCFCFIIANIGLYPFLTMSMESPPSHSSIINNNTPIIPPPLFPPIPPPNNKPILGFEIKDLSQLAPIAISMYCYNEFPRFTMACLSLMLIYTLTTKEIYKKNKKRIIRKLQQYYTKYIDFSSKISNYFNKKTNFVSHKNHIVLHKIKIICNKSSVIFIIR